MNVKIALDISGSMNGLYKSSVVQQTVERLLGLGMNLDSNKSIEVYLFGVNDYYAGEATEGNIEGFVQREILSRFRLENSTNYAGVMKRIGKDAVGYEGNVPVKEQKSGGVFGMFKKKEAEPVSVVKNTADAEATVVYFITDGNNHDKDETRRVIKELSKEPIFWQFVGIGRERFNFLEELDDMGGRHVDNADFFKIQDISKVSDSELYDKLLTELPSWVQTVRQKGMIQ